MNDEAVLSVREEMLDDEITRLYNLGNCKAAVERSIEFLREFPQS